jgi:hypothetical protein
MSCRLYACLLIVGCALLLGCAKEEEEPHAESIPEIPPGRASIPAGEDGDPGYQPPAPPVAR